MAKCDEKEKTKKGGKKEPENYDVALYERLKNLRNRIATERGVFPFRIFPNLPLKHMALQKPTTKEEFLRIYGVGNYTMRQFGNSFIAEIKEYLDETE